MCGLTCCCCASAAPALAAASLRYAHSVTFTLYIACTLHKILVWLGDMLTCRSQEAQGDPVCCVQNNFLSAIWRLYQPQIGVSVLQHNSLYLMVDHAWLESIQITYPDCLN